jgi:hypothetical protein
VKPDAVFFLRGYKMSRTPPGSNGGPPTPYLHPELCKLFTKQENKQAAHNIASDNYWTEVRKENDKGFEWARAKTQAERDTIDAELVTIRANKVKYGNEVDKLDEEISDIETEISEFDPDDYKLDNQDDNDNQSPFNLNLPGPDQNGPSNPNVAKRALVELPGLKGLGGVINTPSAPVAPARNNIPGYNVAQPQGFPSGGHPLIRTDDGKPQLPTLVRLDQQPLHLSEKLYPAMAYKENVYEPWAADTIELATKKFPQLPQQIADSQQLPKDHPDDLADPDYFQLPENPTLMDQLKNGIWKEKKYGKL